MANKKIKPAKPTIGEARDDALKRIQSIYSVDGKFRAQLASNEEGGWICSIWSRSIDGGRNRPMLRNVVPFATLEEAIQMARGCFAAYTGDDRYFAKEDIWQENKTE